MLIKAEGSELMSIPIPAYLKEIAFIEKEINDTNTLLGIKCTCGQFKLQLYKSKADREARAKFFEWDKKLNDYLDSFGIARKGLCFKGGYVYGLDANEEIFGKYSLDDHPMPKSSEVTAYKAACPCCKAEYIIYDNSKYGYNGCICNEEQNDKEIDFYQVKKKNLPDNLFELKIAIENDESYESFLESTGAECDVDTYSNAFSWISIYSFIDGKKTRLYDEETA